MSLPGSREARLFYRCAHHRYEEALVLRKAAYTPGAVYLAGYGVECILKALILNAVPKARQQGQLHVFRGSRAHDYEWLRQQYLEGGGAKFPPAVTRGFTLVSDWTTDLRYDPRTLSPTEADTFLDAAGGIIRWAKGRMEHGDPDSARSFG